ncbi:MAG: SMP-30/gluconolactonase/LRE family protein, partial [Gammaproteobacteria bacterium]|nr:SMP-30/gluconolactonase/LRE family protein [Gammaproteobacteria bacterium]
MKTAAATAALALLCLTQGGAAQEDGCEPSGGLEFVCGPRNVEDLVHVPDTRWIIGSGMAEGASLVLIDSRDKTFSRLYPGDAPRAEHDRETYGQCPGAPADLVTHGLTLLPGRDGRSTLYAVGHGGREAIEVFDVDASGAEPVLTWKGCVPMPEGLEANSVAAFDDGTLLATVLVHPGRTFADQLAGEPTGGVYRWSPGDAGFTLIPGTELPGNNGIEVSEDGEEFFVVSSGLHTITAFSRRTEPAEVLRTTGHLPFTPDNVHRGPDGRLLTAGMKDDVPACGGPPNPQHTLEDLATCPRGFMAVAIDPETME